ncbi:hypothetical protein [Salibacterium aidingense]|uniref:hypothetical protein n=1 Tax=Salibacterium aidingense TaxID=384933 RepID=UPI00047E7B80|nr:hypothetical protein [Salibacterium aidingense]
MCLYGIYKNVNIINPDQNRSVVPVDACIADEIKFLNDNSVITLASCCGHGRAGQIHTWSNAYGEWKGHHQPPIVLIREDSIHLAEDLGYRPYPYYYAEGEHDRVWNLLLKTGCITMEDCRKWHKVNKVPFKRDLGLLAESKRSASI